MAQATQTVIGVYGQNILAIMTYGNTENLVKLMLDNNINGANDQNIAGKPFTFQSNLIQDNFFKQNLGSKVIATASKYSVVVFGEEDLTTIFISEDGTQEFKPEI